MYPDDEARLSARAEAADDRTRLDSFLAARWPRFSRSRVQGLIAGGAVFVNGAVERSKKRPVRAGDTAEVYPPESGTPATAEPEAIPLNIVYEDADVLVIDKAKGMVVHPAPGNETGTLVNAILYHCGDRLSSINGVLRPGIVHRIDKDTSGLLVVAKNDRAHRVLSEALAAHETVRRYEAVAYDNFTQDAGTVDKPVGRDPKNRLRRAVTPENGRRAVTHWRVLERFGRFTHLELTLETGRTHQIRVHMAYIKHPLLGDTLYGPAKHPFGATTQMLHARVLGFRHPATGTYMEFSSPLPGAFSRTLERLRGG